MLPAAYSNIKNAKRMCTRAKRHWKKEVKLGDNNALERLKD